MAFQEARGRAQTLANSTKTACTSVRNVIGIARTVGLVPHLTPTYNLL